MVDSRNLVPGRYYSVKFKSGNVYIGRAKDNRYIDITHKNGKPHVTCGTIGSGYEIIEVSEAYAQSGGKSLNNNQQAKLLLDNEY